MRRTYETDMSVSLVTAARQPCLLLQWLKLERQGALIALSTVETVEPESESSVARAEIAKLQQVLGKKTQESKIPKEVAESHRL